MRLRRNAGDDDVTEVPRLAQERLSARVQLEQREERDGAFQPVLWRDIERGIGIQAVYVLVFVGLSWANFATKDVTS